MTSTQQDREGEKCENLVLYIQNVLTASNSFTENCLMQLLGSVPAGMPSESGSLQENAVEKKKDNSIYEYLFISRFPNDRFRVVFYPQ